MTQPEQWNPSEYTPERIAGDFNVRKAELYSYIIEAASELTCALESDRPADHYTCTLNFFPENHPNAKLPEAINALCMTRELLDTSIDISFDETSPALAIDVRFVIGTDDDNFITQATSTRDSDDYETQTINPKTDQQFDSTVIPSEEINQYVASLLYPSKDGDFSQFNAIKLTDKHSSEALLDACIKHADSHVSSKEFVLQNDNKLRYTVVDDELSTVEVVQCVRDMSVDDDGELIDARSLVTRIETGGYCSVEQFFDYNRSHIHPSSRITANESDLQVAYDFVVAQLNDHPAPDLEEASFDIPNDKRCL